MSLSLAMVSSLYLYTLKICFETLKYVQQSGFLEVVEQIHHEEDHHGILQEDGHGVLLVVVHSET